MATKVSKAEQERIKKAQAQAMEDSARQFLDEKTILNMQAADRQRQQENARRQETERQQAIAQQGMSAEDRLRQSFDQDRARIETETQNRLNRQQADFDQRYNALQADQQRQISDLQRQMNDRQAQYESSIKALQNQFANARSGYEAQLKDQAAANQAAQDTALAQQKASLETAFKQQQEAEKNSAKNQALEDLRNQYSEVGNYTAKTADEIAQQAKDELQSEYDSKLLAARQAQEKSDLALAQQAESIGRSYDKQREQTNKTYDRNVSDADRRALARGMQRSSYNGQVLANIDSERARALQDINEQQVSAEGNIAAQRAQLANQLADTEKSYADSMAADIRARAKELESQEYDRGFQNAQLRSQLASDLYNKQYGQTRDEVADTQWGKTFEEGQRQFNEGQNLTRSENALNRAFTTSEREATQKYQSEEKALDRAFSTSEREAQQQYQAEQAANQQKFQAEQAALNREQEQARIEVQQAFAEKQFEAQVDQWKQEFDYKQKSDEQKIAFEYLMEQIKNGETPTDEMYKAAGLTTSEGQALVAEANEEGSPVITWRQAADAAAIDAGYTGRNDPQIAIDQANASTGGTQGGIGAQVSAAVNGTSGKDEKKKKKTGIMGSAAFD